VALRYLLDTSILSALIRNPQSPVGNRIAEVGESTICTSIIVAAELRFGAEKSDSTKLTDRVEAILSALEVLSLEAPVDQHYATLRWALARRGEPIGPNDMLIAAQALCQGLTVVTANVGEFARVPGLGVENWLER
jgi:tRNA(fMet)-specific endonuclease VapC